MSISRVAHQQEFPIVSTLSESDRKKWDLLGLDPLLLSSCPSFVKFMLDTHLAFIIVGLFNSLDHSETNPIQIDENGQPSLKCEGEWMAWEDLQTQIGFSKNENKFISKQDPKQGWTYVYPDGFIKEDPNEYKKPFPVFQLSPPQYRALIDLASRFHPKEQKVEESEEENCIVQFYTSPEEPSSQRLWKNFHWANNIHLGVRLINEKRELYSFGIAGNHDQIEMMSPHGKKFSGRSLSTVNAYIKMLDFMEFRNFHRRWITSIPTTATKAAEILKRVEALNESGVCYNATSQNCYALADEIMKVLGLPSPVKGLLPREVLWLLLPNAEDFYLGDVLRKIQGFCSGVFIGLTQNVIGTFLCNSIFYAMGGGKGANQYGEDNEEPFWQKQGFSRFSCLYPTWKSLFNPEICKIKHHYSFMQWQLKQGSHIEVPATDKPKLHFLPS